MAKKKEEAVEVAEVACECTKPTILPITQQFGNGEMNILKDKINELIANN